ncbi:MAG: ABC transporter ATP-binding protein [Rhizobiaceae bacterium]
MSVSVVPDRAKTYLPAFYTFAFLTAAARAGAAIILVPLLSALFTTGAADALPWLGWLAVAIAAGWIFETQLMPRAFDFGFTVADNINNVMVDHMLAVPVGELTAKRRAGAKTGLAGSVPDLFAAFVNLGGQITIATMLPFLIGIGLLFVAWPLGIVAIIAAPILIGVLLFGARLMREAEADFAAASEEAATRTDEFARVQAVLRAAGRTGTTGTPLGSAIDAQRSTTLRMLWRTVPGTLIFTVTLQVALVAMVATIAWMFTSGRIDAAVAVALIVVITRYLDPFNTLSDLFPAVEVARGGWLRTTGILKFPALSRPANDQKPGLAMVEFQNVTFAPSGYKVLDNVSFTVPMGTTTAIVGPSGSGKSTILSLVGRFHDVHSGKVLVAGQDVRDYLPGTLMNQLAIVFQNVQLFEGGIADNMRIARPEATEEELQAAARSARVDTIVTQRGGWDSSVGEGGSKLSGGEKQRVSIARALLKSAPILLLDEATSSLDTGNEAAIATALKGYDERTVLIVAHRIETIAHADNILFIEGGRIVEQGPREDLIRNGGRFAGYWEQRRTAKDWRL